MSKLRDASTYLDNLSIGAGSAISGGLDATINALRNPKQAAQGMVQGAQQFAADPMGSMQASAQDFGDKLSSGPMGVGEALGSLIPTPGRVLPKQRGLIIIAPPGKGKGGGRKARETINERVRSGQGPKDPKLAKKGSLTGNAYYEKKQARMNQGANDYGDAPVPAQPGGGTAVDPAVSARRREVRAGLDEQAKLKRDLDAFAGEPQQMRGSMSRTIDRYIEMARKQNPQGYEEKLLPLIKALRDKRGE